LRDAGLYVSMPVEIAVVSFATFSRNVTATPVSVSAASVEAAFTVTGTTVVAPATEPPPM
jgi:hypothetical protein